MVNFEEVIIGTKLKIVNSWLPECNQNPDGLMDCYLGRVVTVKKLWSDRKHLFIEEDSGRWLWNEKCFEYIVEDFDFEAYEVDFSMLLGGV